LIGPLFRFVIQGWYLILALSYIARRGGKAKLKNGLKAPKGHHY